MTSTLIDFIYLVSSGLMLAGIWQFLRPGHSRLGNILGGAGVLLAILATLTAGGLFSIVGALAGLGVGIGLGAFLGLRADQENALGRIALLVAAIGFATALIAGSSIHNIGAFYDAGLAAVDEKWKGFSEEMRRVNEKVTVELQIPWTIAAAASMAAAFGGAIAAAGVISYLKLARSPLRKALPKLEDPAKPQLALVVVCLLLGVLLTAWPGTETFLWLLLVAALALGYVLTIHLKIVDVPPVLAACVAASGFSLAASGLVVGNLLMVTAGALVAGGGAVVAQSVSRSLNVSLLGLVRGIESSRTTASEPEESAEDAPQASSPPPPRVTADPDAPIL
ncbi:NAD(P) transhydrogenase subunit beta [Caulifigura coniformis]|uniref:NAD(P) transhydrogenase subunit beta n=1 Tax=Caulifigura coniformis TaxID=2527983 RepID=A0A517SH61_9PLAN|nr:NAD(P)(+) transhydrogenase (Re/Si-specific) subunit beta [Caulifigura coniformis]QDT55465.1 NAD(P) transhydrogenase subunit beta [Caulifigura coniformis]